MRLKDLMTAHFGEVSGAAFPAGTYIKNPGKNNYFPFVYPNGEEEKITHDMVKCATILAIGETGYGSKTIQIAKYLCVLKDGRQAVLTILKAGIIAECVTERILF